MKSRAPLGIGEPGSDRVCGKSRTSKVKKEAFHSYKGRVFGPLSSQRDSSQGCLRTDDTKNPVLQKGPSASVW